MDDKTRARLETLSGNYVAVPDDVQLARMQLDVIPIGAIQKLLPLDPFDKEPSAGSHCARRRIVHPVAELQAEKPNAESPIRA